MANDKELIKFMGPYSPEIQELTMELRKFIFSKVPEANELIWDNYNALAMAYSKSEKLKDAFCHLALYSKHVNFGFNRGAEISNKLVNLEGSGKLIRHIKVREIGSFPKEAISEMIFEAVGISEERNSELLEKVSLGKSIVMSLSEKKIRPGKG